MKLRFSLILFALLLCVPALAQEKPRMDLPVYPGGETTMEVNLTNDDLLPMMKAMLPMLSGKMGKLADKVDPNQVADALKDVKRLEVLQLAIKKANVTDNDIVNYYGKNVPSGEWNRVFWQSEKTIGTIAVYCKGAGEGIYGFRVQSAVVDGKPVKQIMVAKTEGKIDMVKLMLIASKVMGSK